MDSKERSARSRKVADRLKTSGDPALETPLGREDHLGMAKAPPLVAGDINQPVGARPKSDETAIHDAGSGANETIDGLNATEEALRRGAEDIPVGDSEREEDVPVFDRADGLPKV